MVHLTRRPLLATLFFAFGGRSFAFGRTTKRDWRILGGRPLWKPFEIVTGDTILIPAEVNGRTATAILDTGSAATVLSRDFAAQDSVRSTPTIDAFGLSAQTSVDMVERPKVRLSGIVTIPPFAIVADLDAYRQSLGRAIDVIIGRDILGQRPFALDFGQARICAVPSVEETAGWQQLETADGDRGELLVTADIPNKAGCRLLFDLGSSSPLMLNKAVVDKARLLDGRRRSTAAIGGIDGIMVCDTFMLPALRIGSMTLTDVPTLSAPRWASRDADGDIGLPALQHLDLVLDLARNTVFLRSNDMAERRFDKDRSGFGLAPQPDHLDVVHIAPESPAQGAGWKIHDRIAAIDGQTIDASYTRGTLWRWRYRPAGTAVRLRNGQGRETVLILQDYY